LPKTLLCAGVQEGEKRKEQCARRFWQLPPPPRSARRLWRQTRWHVVAADTLADLAGTPVVLVGTALPVADEAVDGVVAVTA
jgi:hypothetical protein